MFVSFVLWPSAYRGTTVSIQSNASGMRITRIDNIVAAIQKDQIGGGATITLQVGTLGVVGTLFLVIFGKGKVLGCRIVEAAIKEDTRLGWTTIVFQVRTKRMRRTRGPWTFATYYAARTRERDRLSDCTAKIKKMDKVHLQSKKTPSD